MAPFFPKQQICPMNTKQHTGHKWTQQEDKEKYTHNTQSQYKCGNYNLPQALTFLCVMNSMCVCIFLRRLMFSCVPIKFYKNMKTEYDGLIKEMVFLFVILT